MDLSGQKKSRGAFYTPPEIARYLANWAIRSPNDLVLEPSCGEAIFLLAAAERLKFLSSDAHRSRFGLYGVEIHEESAKTAKGRVEAAGFDASIETTDFFGYSSDLKFQAVVGNPPFVRYQNFTGAVRAQSLEAALAQGVRLSGLASSWAAFVVKASLHLAPEGRLALIVPAELLSVSYAHEIRRFLLKRFSQIKLIVFEERVFPGVLEEVVLLLAEGVGGANYFELHQARNFSSLGTVDEARWIEHVPGENEKWTPALVAKDVLSTYQTQVAKNFEDLEHWGRTYLGAVTGNNKFFTMTLEEAREHDLDDTDLIRISPPGSRHLRGLSYTDSAWNCLAKHGARCLLFYPESDPSAAAQKYVDSGESRGVANAYKCRVRRPWWRIPLVETPDVFLTYMNHDRPRFVTNAAKVQILNSLYGVAFRVGRKQFGRELLPIACLNSVTLLGSEIVGRAYGGGLLKLEPREADKLPVPSLPFLQSVADRLKNMKPQLAQALRNNEVSEAVEAVDSIILSGISDTALETLREAREALFERRRARGKSVKNR